MSMELIDRDRAIRIAEQGQVKGFEWQLKQLVTEPPVKAIPKDQYEARLKIDMVAMLTDLQLEIEEIDSRAGYDRNGMPTISTDYVRIIKVNEIIQQKINKLKEVGE